MLERIYFSQNGEMFTYVWEDSTFFFYVSFLFVVLLVGHVVQRDDFCVNKSLFVFIFIYLYLFCGFRDTTVGRDTEMYTDIFNDSKEWSNISDWGVEPGFFLLNKIFHFFVGYEKLGVPIFAFITYFLIFKTIYRYSLSINIQATLYLLVCIGFYLQSFDLLRISLATSIELYFFHYVIERQYYKYFIVLLCCLTVHYSTLLMFIPLISLILYRKNPLFFLVVIGVMIVVATFVISHLEFFIFFARYEHYTMEDIDKIGIGPAQFVYNLPILALAFYVYKKKYGSHDVLQILFVYCVICFIYGLVGYFVPVGRTTIHFLMIYVLLIPYCLAQLKVNNDKYYRIIYLICIVYGVVRYHYYLVGYLFSDGIMPYRMLNLFAS